MGGLGVYTKNDEDTYFEGQRQIGRGARLVTQGGGPDDGFVARLAFAIGDEPLRQFAARGGLHENSVRGYLVYGKDPSRTALCKLADAAEVSIEWLASGRGEPFPPPLIPPFARRQLRRAFALYRQTVAGGYSIGAAVEMYCRDYGAKDAIVETIAGLPTVSEQLLWSVIRDHVQAQGVPDWRGFAPIPTVGGEHDGKTFAFFPLDFIENDLRLPVSEVCAVRVNSAAPGASLREGDWVLVDRRAAGMPIKDGLYIVRMAGVPFLRHFSVRPDGKILALMGSAALPPIEMPEDILTPENIVGKVVVTVARV